jgi:hypothetical protein
MPHANLAGLINQDRTSATMGSTFTYIQSPPLPAPNPATWLPTPVANSATQTRHGLKCEYAMIIQPPDFTLADQSLIAQAMIAVDEQQPTDLIQSFELAQNLASDGKS